MRIKDYPLFWIFAIPFVSSLFLYLTLILLGYYYHSAQRTCNTGLAPCGNGIVESIIAFIVIVGLSLYGIWSYYRKMLLTKIPAVVFFGALLAVMSWFYLLTHSLWKRELLFLLYPLSFGLISILLNISNQKIKGFNR
ncbi:MAG: hypothetical protein Q8Q49_02665 [bacterium]|nr:hypothetical protein [bacterium]